MNRCLNDETLFLLQNGEGTSDQRSHLKECEVCAARYQQLVRDIEAIIQLLREEPPPNTVSVPSRLFTIRWLPTTAALATALLLMWVGVRLWSPSGKPPLKGTDASEARSLLDELPWNPFLTDALAVELATEGAGSREIAAVVLEAQRPCEWYDLPAMGEIESSVEDPEILVGTHFRSCVEVQVNSVHRKRGVNSKG
jgi:hypothetical protein